MIDITKLKIAVIGLGYVGLPVSVLLSEKYKVQGFDIDKSRIDSLNLFVDNTLEISSEKLESSLNNNLILSNDIEQIRNCNIYIITVPTPIKKNKTPDLGPLLKATSLVGTLISKENIIIYESTVFPGCTEDECVPVLERESNLKYNIDFYCGYSPERINPGDKNHSIEKIVKVTSGSTPEIAELIDKIYSSVIKAGTFKASSIRVAEASKVIENAQRDINIAFVNELAMIFNKIGIDTNDVLDAASTKWNFLNFRPGLVGGHCIGVDPYYLAEKAKKSGYQPNIILSGRELNDKMGTYVADEVIKLLKENNRFLKNPKVLVLGVTFKENCPDHRNTKIIDILFRLKEFDINVDAYDPWVDKKLFKKDYSFKISKKKPIKKYDAIILAVSHSAFKKLNLNKLKVNENSIVYDIKGFLDKKNTTKRL